MTEVHAVEAHLHPGHVMVSCTVHGPDSVMKRLSATPNHEVVKRSDGKMVPVCLGDLECGEELVGKMGEPLKVMSIFTFSSGCVYEVETGTGTILVNDILARATSADYIVGEPSFSRTDA